MISNRRYHFIIPAPEIGDRPLGLATGSTNEEQDHDQSSPSSTITTTNMSAHDLCGKVCPNCHDPVGQLAVTCSLCNVAAVSGSILDLHTHLLHGVLHCNGFGHLLCVNGRERVYSCVRPRASGPLGSHLRHAPREVHFLIHH